MDTLEVLHKNSANVAGNLGRKRSRISLKIGIIGALQGG